MSCIQCPKEGDYEWFYFFMGSIVFDVEKAKKIVEGREVVTTKVATANLHTRYTPKAPDTVRTLDLMGAVIVEEHLDHVDTSKPLIFAKLPSIFKGYGLSGSWILIDGNHRVARAVREGQEMIDAVLLTPEETASIMQVNARHVLKPKGRSKRVTKTKAASPAPQTTRRNPKADRAG